MTISWTIGYYRRFTDNFSDMAAVLTPFTARLAPDHLDWTSGMVSAFESLCNSLCNRVVSYVPIKSDNFVFFTDASARGVRCVLCII